MLQQNLSCPGAFRDHSLVFPPCIFRFFPHIFLMFYVFPPNVGGRRRVLLCRGHLANAYAGVGCLPKQLAAVTHVVQRSRATAAELDALRGRGDPRGGEAQALRMEAGPLEAFTPWHPWLISVSLHAITKLSDRNTKGEGRPSFRPGSGRFSASRDAPHRPCGERPRGPSAFRPHRPHRL